MKNLLLFILIPIFGFSQISTDKNFLVGVSTNVIPISNSFSIGVGFTLNTDYKTDGKGFGYIVEAHYLVPKEDLKELIDFASLIEGKVKYDFQLNDKIEVAPNLGFGFYNVSFDNAFGSVSNESIEKFFISGGGSIITHITNRFFAGANISYPFLEGSEVIIGLQILFKI